MNEATTRQRCSAVAREQEEPLYGTAPVTKAWLLIEQPGAWGPDALLDTPALDSEVAAELNRRSKEHGFRILLIRRSAARAEGSGRCCFLVRSAQSQTWIERLEIKGAADVLELEPQVFGRPSPPKLGDPVDCLWAVCTHGRRDPCCAEYGRRLARSFEGGPYQPGLWESSHQGGHRFAANLAVFPHGLFYGQVAPADAGRVLDAYRDGRLILDGYRGRSAFDGITQAADYMVRRELGLTGIDDLVPQATQDLGDGRYSVDFNGVMGTLSVGLEVSEGPLRPESCNKPKLTAVKQFRQLDLTPDVGESPTY